MPWDLLIRNGQVVTPDGVRRLDLAVEDGKVAELTPELRGTSREEIDAAGLHVFPGVIDPHVHFNEPGRTDWEGWATGSAALTAGGGTCCFDMPLNSSPPTLDGPSFDLKRAAAEASSVADFGLWGGLTPGNLDRLEELADRGVVGFKAFMSDSGIDDFRRADEETLRKGMEIAARLGVIVAVHAEDEQLTAALTQAIHGGGDRSWNGYLVSRPTLAEVQAILKAVAIAIETGCMLHVVHVSSAAGIAEAQAGRSMTVPVILDERDAHAAARLVSAETCPHYLLFTVHDIHRLGAVAKCAPPLRNIEDVARLSQEVASDGIDFVASDHSPSLPSMKTGDDAFEIWGGIAGVQSTLPALLTIEPRLPIEQVAKLTSTNAADRFGIKSKGRIVPGFDADLALIDFDAIYTLTRDMLLDRHKLSPYVGRRFKGLVKRTIVRGRTVFLDGRIISKPIGRLVTPRRGTR